MFVDLHRLCLRGFDEQVHTVFCSMVVVVSYGVEVDVHIGASVVVLLLPVGPDVVIGPVVAAAVYGSVAVVNPGIAVEATAVGA